MKDIEKTLNLNGKEYPVVFNLNVMQAIQERYGSLEAWGEVTEAQTEDDGNKKKLTKEPDAKAVIFGFTEMINEGIDIRNDKEGKNDAFLTERQVGRLLTEYGLAKALALQNQTVIESTQSAEKN
jgi:hypothetical protein